MTTGVCMLKSFSKNYRWNEEWDTISKSAWIYVCRYVYVVLMSNGSVLWHLFFNEELHHIYLTLKSFCVLNPHEKRFLLSFCIRWFVCKFSSRIHFISFSKCVMSYLFDFSVASATDLNWYEFYWFQVFFTKRECFSRQSIPNVSRQFSKNVNDS